MNAMFDLRGVRILDIDLRPDERGFRIVESEDGIERDLKIVLGDSTYVGV